MKIIILIILISPIVNSLKAQDKLLIERMPYETPFLFYDVKFLNENTGFICGEGGAILKTTNAGNNWSLLFSGIGEMFRGIYVNPENNNIYMCGTSGSVVKTTNLGNNWTILNSSLNESFNSISGYGDNFLIICSESGYIFKSENGGKNFDAVLINNTTLLTAIKCLPNENIFVVGHAGKMYKSDNFGSNWTVMNSNTDKNIHELYFLNSLTGYFVGLPGNIFKTVDGGNSWQFQNSNVGNSLRSVHFFNQNRGFVVGYTTNILWTNDGGNIWKRQNVEPAENVSLNSVFMKNDSVAFAVGYNGLILKMTIKKNIDTTITSTIYNFALSQNYPNPFNSGTVIKYEISKTERYRLQIYDVSGSLVLSEELGILPPGNYSFNFIPENLSSGVYYYRLIGGSVKTTKKLVYIK